MQPRSSEKHLQDASRRDFLKMCAAISAVLGLGPGGARAVYGASLASRPSVLWLHLSECTGCTESVLRLSNPWFDELVTTAISLDYHETLMAGAGSAAEQQLVKAAQDYQGNFFCVVEGAVPTADNGVYGMIGGRTMLSMAQEICPKAKAIIALGTCASYGGLPAALPNPTGAKGIAAALPGLAVPVINCAGCPPNPVNFASLLVNYLLTGTTPPLDLFGRPVFAYSRKVHSMCPYVNTPRCLYDDGCKGHQAYNNCPEIKFNDGVSFPMQAGHPCIGCVQPDFWDKLTPFYKHRGTQAVRNPGIPSYPPEMRREAMQRDRFDLLGRHAGAADQRRGAANGLRILRRGWFSEKVLDF